MSIQHRLRFLLALAFTATLASAALADNAAVVGTWEITIEDDYFDEADLEITLEIEEDEEGKLTATWSTPRGDDDLEDVKWNGKKLTFVRFLDFGGREIEVEHWAKVKGDTLEGKIEMRRRDVEFSGQREH
jgi:hypothetical protein